MKVLAIETSTLTGSVALLEDEALLAESTLSVSLQHSERLMPAIEEMLRNARVEPSDIDLYAVSHGPGSFTGLRIGIAAAQGLSMACGKPLVGVPTLQGLAMHGVFFEGRVVSLLNAFRKEVYCGIYSIQKGLPILQGEERVLSLPDLLSELRASSEKTLLLGDALKGYASELQEAFTYPQVVSSSPLFWTPRAGHVGLIGLRQWRTQPTPEVVLPRYLRLPG